MSARRVTNSCSAAAAEAQSVWTTAVSAASSTTLNADLRQFAGELPADRRDIVAARGILLEQPANERHALVGVRRAAASSAAMSCSCGSLPAVSAREVLARGLHVAVGHEGPRQMLAQFGVFGVEARRLAQHLQRLVRPAGGIERRGQRLELLGRDRALAGALEIAGAEVHIEQALADFLVVRA